MSEITIKQCICDSVLESFCEMRNAQPPKDRLHYFDVVLEGSAETNAILLQNLYNDIIARSNVDYGTIPDSQGVLIKYKEYDLMVQSMDKINSLFGNTPTEEVTMMNKLHDMIITCKKDYEFGYKFNVEIVKIAYCTAVLTLYELINICILEYTSKLRSKSGIGFKFNKVKKKDILILRGAKSLLKSYETGQWTRMMNEFKKDPSIIGLATEAGIFDKSIGEMVEPFINKYNIMGGPGAAAKFNPKGLVNAVSAGINKIPLPIKIIAIVIGIFIAIRELIVVFFNSAMKMKDYLRTQKEFVDATISQELQDGTPDAVINKHQKLAERLEGIANFIEVRVLKTNTDAKKDLESTNKENYSKQDLNTQPSNGFGGSIEF